MTRTTVVFESEITAIRIKSVNRVNVLSLCWIIGKKVPNTTTDNVYSLIFGRSCGDLLCVVR